MPQMINTNVASLNAQRNLNSSQASLNVSLQRLSSGLRINSAKDDAAGLAVAQRMSSQIRSLNQAVRNANDGISMLQTAEGAMNEMQNMLQRMKELATQGANGTIGDTERGFIATEVSQLRDEMQAIAERTTFNGQSLLTGALSTSIDATTGLNAGTVVVAGTNTSIASIDVSSAQAGRTFTLTAGTAADQLVLTDGTSGVSQTITLSAIAADSTGTANFSQLGVKFTLSSVAGETAANIRTGMLAGATDTVVTAAGSSSLSLQVGSGTSASDSVSISFADVRVNNSAAGAITTLDTAIDNFTGGTATQAEAQTLMSAVDGALDFFSTQRATMGAVQNRLETTVANGQSTAENLSASRSRIQDADYASETAALTRGQILQQAGVAMLAQANALPNNVMALLRG
ncbi:MAG: flagellin [Betaproteobacteria bacterium]|nr:flagellin [Betaproteobacteria bacterium]